MRFNIRGNKVEVTDAIKKYIEEKIGKLDKYFENPDDMTANIAIRIRGIEQIVEVTIPAKKVILRGEESHKDLYAAIDLVSEKIERQIRKNKTRMHKKVNKESISGFIIDFETEHNDNEENVIVKRKTIEMKPMSEEEAILQMNLLGHEFFVFREVESANICVIYRRKDNNYGIIKTN
jgi:putative sigma-54 modulation protein